MARALLCVALAGLIAAALPMLSDAACSAGCVVCDYTTCLACASGLFTYYGECVASCPAGFFGNTGFCAWCPQGCATCAALDNCFTCQAGHTLSAAAGTCVADAGAGGGAGSCTITAGTQTADAFVVVLSGCAGTVSLAHTNITTPSGVLGTQMVLGGAAAQELSDPQDATGSSASFPILRTAPAIMQHGSYFVIHTDGGGVSTAYGPFDSQCQAQRGADYTPPTLVLAASTVETDPATQIPQLMLQFTADKADNSVAFEFLFDKSRADSRCGVDFNYGFAANARGTAFPANSQSGPDAAGNGFWSMTINDLPACAAGVTYQYQVTNFNNAIANCGWVRLERPGGVELQTTVLATSLQQGSRIRNVLVSRTLESSVTVGIVYTTAITATVGPLRVFGPVINEATLQAQVFEPLSSTASWGLLTSVQGPYQLARKEVGAVPVPAEGVTGPSFTEMTEAAATLLGLPAAPELTGINSDANAHYSGAVTNLAKCVAQGADGSLTTQAIDYADSTGTYAACVQRWFNQATKATCTTEAPDQNLNIAWSVSFDVTCHASFTGSCATTPATNLVTVSWNTYSDNYCPRIIDTEASTAELKVYEKSDFTAEQSQFVFGTKSYFEATATSSIKIEDLETEKITIVSGGANAGQVVYFKENFAVLVDAWWSADSATAAAAGTPAAFLGTFAKNVTGADDLHRKTQWSWTWSAANSAASGDFPTSASVQVDLRIRYTNQNAAAPKRLDVLSVGFHPQLSAASAAASAQTNVGVTARATGAAPAPTSGASSSSAMSAQTIAIGVAVVGGVALVAAGVAVARRRSVVAKSTAANVDTVEMRGVPTATNVV